MLTEWRCFSSLREPLCTAACCNYYSYQLVCRAFHGPKPTDKHTVDHIDRNSANNSSANLKWASTETQRSNQTKGRKRCISIPIIGRLFGDLEWTKYSSAQDAADKLSLNTSAISKTVRGEYTHTGGYEFQVDFESMEPIVLDGEVWMPLYEHEDSWQVSNFGRVKHLLHNGGWSYPRTPVRRRGCEYASIGFNDQKKILLHVAVFQSFNRRKVKKGFVIDHIDSNKNNNHLSNLQEITLRQNTKKEYDNGNITSRVAEVTGLQVHVWDETDSQDVQPNIRTYISLSEACRNESVTRQGVNRCFRVSKCNPVLFKGRYWKKVFSTHAQ